MHGLGISNNESARGWLDHTNYLINTLLEKEVVTFPRATTLFVVVRNIAETHFQSEW
jgi:hypothetical protein